MNENIQKFRELLLMDAEFQQKLKAAVKQPGLRDFPAGVCATPGVGYGYTECFG